MSTAVLAPEIESDALMDILSHQPLVFESQMTTEQFHAFILRHTDLRIERDNKGLVTIHPPMTLDSGFLEGEVFFHLKLWSKKDGSGKAYSPSTSFQMPDGATYKADGAWISNGKLEKLSKAERKKIAAVVPDFVIEVRSETDRIAKLKEKMTDGWMANGVKLAWLIDPQNEEVHIYRKNQKVETIKGLKNKLSGEDILPGFEFDLGEMKAG